jgi:hypothetical protein
MGCVRRKRAFVAALVLAAAAAGAGTARADGDPASDVLVLYNVFVPYEAPSKTAVAGLSKQVQAAYAAGYRVKVAVVATSIDLGAISSLFGKPTEYAKFLGQELSSFYIGPLLIVMPGGYGIYDGGRSTQAEDGVLAGLARPVSAKPNDLVSAATTAVGRLLGAGALKSTDILKPFVDMLAGSVKLHTLSVRYYLFDDSGKAAVTVTILRGSQILYTAQIAAHVTGNDKPELRTAALPSGLGVADARVCVVGVDAAGNRSPPSCKKLVVR